MLRWAQGRTQEGWGPRSEVEPPQASLPTKELCPCRHSPRRPVFQAWRYLWVRAERRPRPRLLNAVQRPLHTFCAALCVCCV